MPIWPNSKGFKLSWTKRLDIGDACNNSAIECDAHVGTHLDAPLHFIQEGLSVENFQIDILIGSCLVVYFPKVTKIHAMIYQQLIYPRIQQGCWFEPTTQICGILESMNSMKILSL